MLQAGKSRVRVSKRWIFSIYLSFQPHHGPGVNSASNRNKYQESSWGLKGGRPGWQTHHHLWADCLEKLWKPRSLTTIWAFTARYRDRFTFLTLYRCPSDADRFAYISIFTTFYGTLKFVILFTAADHWTPYWASWNHFIHWRHIL
jgi:hypothetical protein